MTAEAQMVRKALKFGDAIAEPGRIAKVKIPVFEYCDGTIVSLPMMVLNGVKDGPILFLNASFHGPELSGSEVIRRIIREEVKADELKGAIIGCLCANPLSVQHGHVKGNPRDDMHLQIPGKPDGSGSERIGNAIWTQCCQPVIDNPDLGALVDLHCTGISPPWAINIILFDETYLPKGGVEKARAFGKAWGWTFEDNLPAASPSPPSNWKQILASKGIPSFTTEMTDSKRMTGPSVDTAVRGVKNGMKSMGMIPGPIERQSGIKVAEGDFVRDTSLFANRGGYIYANPKAPAGDFLLRGTVLATIKDVYGDVVSEVKMEKDGYYYSLIFDYLNTSDTIGTGDEVARRFNKKP